MLADCRGLLNYAAAVREKVQLLRGGDIGVLKVAASPQFIEGVLAEFLHRYATLFPGVQVKLREALGWGEVQGLLERGDIHIGQSLANAVPPYEPRFESHHLMPLELLLAFEPRTAPTPGDNVEIRCLAKYPLLVLDTNYANRRMFDAACRLAGLEPTIAFESRTPHTLIAMAESGHGVAVIPSTMRFRSDRLRVAHVTFQKNGSANRWRFFGIDGARCHGTRPRFAARWPTMLVSLAQPVNVECRVSSDTACAIARGLTSTSALRGISTAYQSPHRYRQLRRGNRHNRLRRHGSEFYEHCRRRDPGCHRCAVGGAY
jgi:hypothetical protein